MSAKLILKLIQYTIDMSKRSAPYQIDQRTFEERDQVKPANGSPPIQSNTNNESHMIGRKIFKLARNQDKPAESNDKVDLKIQGLNQIKPQQKKEQNKTHSNLFNTTGLFENNSSGLFSNAQSLFANPFSNKSTESDSQNNKQAAKTAENFAKDEKQVATSSQVKNDLKQASQQKKIQKAPPTSLFSNFGNNSLFGNVSQGGFSSKPMGNSLFSSNTSGSSLFSSTSGGLFSNTGGLMSFPSTQPSFFPQLSKPNEDEQGDSQQLQKEQQMKTGEVKMLFDYGNENTILSKVFLDKYKKDNGNLIEQTQAILSYNKSQNIHNIFIILRATKNRIYSGYILKNSSFKVIGNRIDLLAFSVNPEQGNQMKPSRLKLMPAKDQKEIVDEFIKKIQEIINKKNE